MIVGKSCLLSYLDLQSVFEFANQNEDYVMITKYDERGLLIDDPVRIVNITGNLTIDMYECRNYCDCNHTRFEIYGYQSIPTRAVSP